MKQKLSTDALHGHSIEVVSHEHRTRAKRSCTTSSGCKLNKTSEQSHHPLSFTSTHLKLRVVYTHQNISQCQNRRQLDLMLSLEQATSGTSLQKRGKKSNLNGMKRARRTATSQTTAVSTFFFRAQLLESPKAHEKQSWGLFHASSRLADPSCHIEDERSIANRLANEEVSHQRSISLLAALLLELCSDNGSAAPNGL